MNQKKPLRPSQVQVRETPSRLGGDFVQQTQTPSIPIGPADVRGAVRGYSGDDAATRALFAGPTKRSADVNDYTALEADVARAGEENARLRAQIDAVLKRERSLLWQIKRLEAIAEIDPDEVRLYVAAREARARYITRQTPLPAIDAALEWQKRAVDLADALVDAIAKTERP